MKSENYTDIIREYERLKVINHDLVEALKNTKASIEEAVMLSTMNNGYEYSFKSTIEKINTALKKAGG